MGILSLERSKGIKDETIVLEMLVEKLQIAFEKEFPLIKRINDLPGLFTKRYFKKPFILIMDEFDALEETFINRFAGIFRDIFIGRTNERNKKSNEKTHLLHGLALVGVRSVLGIENEKGSPFNTQRNLHIPNLGFEEVEGMFRWYQEESGQIIEPGVIKKLYRETRGQPGLTCWLGELLSEGTENFPNDTQKPIREADFDNIYQMAVNILPNNNILNIINKADTLPYRYTVLGLFNTNRPQKFMYDKKDINFLYMNGVVEPEIISSDTSYTRFASPFIQKRLFNYFSAEIFCELGNLTGTFFQAGEIVSGDHIDIPQLLRLYQTYLDNNKTWLFKDVPRRSDMRIYEAIFHFNIYAYLDELMRGKNVQILPEFPTGNGKIDLLIRYGDKTYGIELKSFSDLPAYYDALEQAARYAGNLKLKDIYLVSFIESIDEKNKKKYEALFHHPKTGVWVHPIFILTGQV